VSELVSWNSWVGSMSNCDRGIYAGLADVGERPVCVGVEGNGPIASSATLT
jgi:hypothetical protein